MALTIQIIFLCLCCFLADSYLFALEFYDGEDHYRIPLGLSDAFKLYPGMFDPPGSYAKSHHQHHNRPLISDVTTAKQFIEDKIITTESPLTTTEKLEDDNILVTKPDSMEHEQDLTLKKNLKIGDEMKQPSIDVTTFPQVNTLSIHNKPILSVKIPDDREKTTTELPKVEAVAVEEAINDIRKQNNESDPGLIKNTDYVLIPVNNLNPVVVYPNVNINDGSNTLTSMAGIENRPNQGYPINGVNNMNPNFNNRNPNLVNTALYGNQPIQYGNAINSQNTSPNQGIPGNPYLYTMVTIPNMQSNNMQTMGTPNNNNLYYLNNGNPNMVQPNSFQAYNLVPITNYPNNLGVNQPNNFIRNNQPNNFVPNYNQPMSGPYNNVPNNYVPINQRNNFIPANNNYIPITQPNNFVPLNNNNPNNFPINQRNNNIPYYNQPNSFNGQPNNFVPNNNFNNQPNNFIPYNNVPGNLVPNQDNFSAFKDQNNKAVINNGGASQPQPIVALVALNDTEDADNSTLKSDEQKAKDLSEP